MAEVGAAATAIASRLEQERPAVRARRPRSSAPMAFFLLRILRPLICFLRAVEHASRLSRIALCWMALVAMGTKVPSPWVARRTLALEGIVHLGRRPQRALVGAASV